MGIVFRAYDTKLKREVALKRLKASGADADARARLIREAQAMAQLSHPNVIAVYDVETHEHEIFVAMEFVQGPTLRQWLKESRRWERTLDLLIQAGRGLAAAHAAGMVHRDFKPANVLVGDDGRVRVMDFGLAVTRDRVSLLSSDSHDLKIEADPSRTGDLTQDGMVLGTPAYMAPEQHDGRPADAKSDLYAFCASAWEALYRIRPFRGSLAALRIAKSEGPPPLPPDLEVPRWIGQALRRGLQARPDDRWPDLPSLLHVLERDPRARRRKWMRSAIFGTGLLSIGAAVQALGGGSSIDCGGAAARLADVWGPERRREIRQGIEAVGLPYAADTARTVDRALDGYAQDWVAAYADACEATHVRGEQSARILDLRMRCLDGRRERLAAALTVLEEPDAALLERAVDLATGLPRPEGCADVEALEADVPPPDDAATARAVERIRAALSTARTTFLAAKLDVAWDQTERLVPEAMSSGYDPVLAEAKLLAGEVLIGLGRYDEALPHLNEAHTLALRQRQPEIALAGLAALADVEHERGNLREAQRWAAGGRELAAWAAPDTAKHAELLRASAQIAQTLGSYEDAVAGLQRALAIDEAIFGPDHPALLHDYLTLGSVLVDVGEHDRAREVLTRGLALQQRTTGAMHPQTGSFHAVLGRLEAFQGRIEVAAGHFEQARDIHEKSLGADHPGMATLLNNLGVTHYHLGDLERAELHFREAAQIRERALGPWHPDLAAAWHNLAGVLGDQGEIEAAIELHQKALDIWRKNFGPDHPDVALGLSNVGLLYLDVGQLDRAEDAQRKALELARSAFGPKHVQVSDTLYNLGNVLIAKERWHEAEDVHRQAWSIRSELLETGSADRVRSQLVLAEVAEARGQLERASVLVDDALSEARVSKQHIDVLLVALTGASELACQRGEYDTALRYADEAREHLEGAELPDLERAVDRVHISHARARALEGLRRIDEMQAEIRRSRSLVAQVEQLEGDRPMTDELQRIKDWLNGD